MKVILVKLVNNLGAPGEIVEVSPGYGRNFLIPKGIAKEATADEVNKALSAKHSAGKARQKKEKENQKLRGILEGQNILIRAKANEEGNLFGGVGAREIAQAIAKRKKQEVDEKQIDLSRHIKTLGKHEVDFKLGQGEKIKFIVDIKSASS